MTCIAGLVYGKDVYVGGDSAAVGGLSLTVRSDEKVFLNGDMLFGFTSSFRMGQILRYGFTPPKLHQGDDVYEYMVTRFVDAVRERFRSAGHLSVDRGQESAGTFLVGFQGRLFRIDSDFQVGESLDRYDAVGCGQDIALGCLYAVKRSDGFKSPEKAILLSLEAAEAHSAGVRKPFHVLHT
ncbi:MAG: hypothetical protein P4L67_04930 [Candidatus Pacebacteria bacterium]|nr:hypothetical protein [Candidatus Paceibacterota bacterium]